MTNLEELKEVNLNEISEEELNTLINDVLSLNIDERVAYMYHAIDNYISTDELSKNAEIFFRGNKDKFEDVFEIIGNELSNESNNSDLDDIETNETDLSDNELED